MAQAAELWRAMYPDLAADREGLAGSVLGRAEGHVLRLSLIYALLDRSSLVRVEHLVAATELWAYAERSVSYIFGDATGDPVADAILTALRGNGELTRTQISELFGRHEGVGPHRHGAGATALPWARRGSPAARRRDDPPRSGCRRRDLFSLTSLFSHLRAENTDVTAQVEGPGYLTAARAALAAARAQVAGVDEIAATLPASGLPSNVDPRPEPEHEPVMTRRDYLTIARAALASLRGTSRHIPAPLIGRHRL